MRKAMGQNGAILSSYDFGAFSHIVDAGGGHRLIRPILRAHPALP
jgi:hypothetical protein